MKRLIEVYNKQERVVAGLMSGTSVDGIDVAIVRISGNGTSSKVKLLAFENRPFPDGLRDEIFGLFDEQKSNNKTICYMNFVLGDVFAKALIDTCEMHNISLQDIDVVGSHGQTIYHFPTTESRFGFSLNSTLQIGDGDVIAERTGCITVSDFRTRDCAVGGQGAPLVPYTEFLLFREENPIGLLNIGGISNITILPTISENYEDGLKKLVAFDIGPGNMVIDCAVNLLTNGKLTYDKGGEMALAGKVDQGILSKLLDYEYFKRPAPKTCGREQFGTEYTKSALALTEHLPINDRIAIMTALTAESIKQACKSYTIKKLVVGGGGSYNKALMSMLQGCCETVCNWEDLGQNSDAKEAVAFAVLANETISGNCGNVYTATGAKRPVILGKISL